MSRKIAEQIAEKHLDIKAFLDGDTRKFAESILNAMEDYASVMERDEWRDIKEIAVAFMDWVWSQDSREITDFLNTDEIWDYFIANIYNK